MLERILGRISKRKSGREGGSCYVAVALGIRDTWTCLLYLYYHNFTYLTLF
jgi:hypothetical protein